MRDLSSVLRNEHGIVLFVSLFILALLMASGVAAMYSTQSDLKTSSNLKTGKQVFYIAEAGLNRGWQEMNDGDGIADFDSVANTMGATTLYLDASFSGGSHTVVAEAITGSRPKRVRLISTGCLPSAEPCPSGHSKASLEAHLRRGSLFPCAVCGLERVDLAGGAKTDSFDSAAGPYSPILARPNGHVISNGDMTLAESATEIRGNAAAVGAVATSGGATVTGSTTSGSVPYAFPSTAPCGPPYSSAAGVQGGNYDAITGQLQGSGSQAIVLANGSYCFSSVLLSDTSTLNISGPVVISVTSPSSFTGGGVFNTTGKAENLKIFSNFASSTPGIRISGSGLPYLTIYAPKTAVEVLGGGELYGSIVGKRVTSTGGARFHYDEQLTNNEDGKVEVVFWKEAF